jgi:hypothetical protein
MQVVVIADFADAGGGAQRVALESARALAEAGVAVTYVHAVGPSGIAALGHPRIEDIGFGLPDVWDQPAAQAARSGIWNGLAAARLKRMLAGLPPGPVVIHLHQWTRAFSPAILPVLFATGLPVAIKLHDYFLARTGSTTASTGLSPARSRRCRRVASPRPAIRAATPTRPCACSAPR